MKTQWKKSGSEKGTYELILFDNENPDSKMLVVPGFNFPSSVDLAEHFLRITQFEKPQRIYLSPEDDIKAHQLEGVLKAFPAAALRIN